MQWDLGLEGLALLAGISVGFGLLAGVLVGNGAPRRLATTIATTLACFIVGLITSEGIFGWATSQELQPNVDGLSRDEVLLSSVVTTVVIVALVRYLSRESGQDQARASDTDARSTSRVLSKSP